MVSGVDVGVAGGSPVLPAVHCEPHAASPLVLTQKPLTRTSLNARPAPIIKTSGAVIEAFQTAPDEQRATGTSDEALTEWSPTGAAPPRTHDLQNRLRSRWSQPRGRSACLAAVAG